MNIKEAFRYESFIDNLMNSAYRSIADCSHAQKVVKVHHKSKANPEAEDLTEEVNVACTEFYPNDEVISFMEFLVEEKEKIMKAVSEAKASCGLDIDAAIGTNKLRQNLATWIQKMLKIVPATYTESGTDHKFNVEGNQISYFYEVEVEKTDNFDRESAKSIMRKHITKADEVSKEVEKIMVLTEISYTPPFNVNDSFEDAMAAFLSMR